MFASGKEELKVRARMTANLYDPEDRAELSKVFSAAGLAASKHGAAMRGKIRIPEKPKEGETLDVTGLIHSLKDSHEHQSINDALLELGLITKVEKPVDVAIVFNMQGLLLKVSS